MNFTKLRPELKDSVSFLRITSLVLGIVWIILFSIDMLSFIGKKFVSKKKLSKTHQELRFYLLMSSFSTCLTVLLMGSTVVDIPSFWSKEFCDGLVRTIA